MQAARSLPLHIDDQGPRPVVAGTRIKVSQIASEYDHLGMTPDQIVEAHPHLSLGDIHAALAYYYDHRDKIQAEWIEAQTLIDALRRKYPAGTPDGRSDV
ncbi:MAG: DUF433 domain-containing protein [Polyangiaceae bacterium]